MKIVIGAKLQYQYASYMFNTIIREYDADEKNPDVLMLILFSIYQGTSSKTQLSSVIISSDKIA